MSSATSEAKAAGKKLLVEEWGSLAPSGSARTANIESNVQKINNYKVPWFYWELITNPDPGEGQDYEVCVFCFRLWCVFQNLIQSIDTFRLKLMGRIGVLYLVWRIPRLPSRMQHLISVRLSLCECEAVA